MGIVGILMCGAVSHPWLGLDWLEWASMAILLVVLACTVGALMWDSSKRGSSEPFLQQAQWIVLVGLLVGSVVLFLALGQGWLRVARVLMWFLVVVLLSMIRTLLQLRCVTMEHWLRPRSKIPSL
jgi:phosphatidylglycerophosphate synthase